MDVNGIRAFMHCKRCLQEMPAGMAPREWVRVEVGWTATGLQVWCVRHECNLINIHFDGKKVRLLPGDYPAEGGSA